MAWSDRRTLGRTGLEVSRIGLGSSFGIGDTDIERAFERGVRYFYWGSIRRPGFGRGIATLAPRHRDEMVVVVQSYTRAACLMRTSLERALRKLRIDHADLLLLGWWQAPPPRRIVDAARKLKEEGKAKHIMISCHHRPTFEALAADPLFGAIMVRYNAAHPGAEKEVFPLLGERPPGVVAYTATRWGALINPKLTPPGEATPRASDCYRFALTHPAVDMCLAGPADGSELDEALAALERGPMSDDELAWMKRVGSHIRSSALMRTNNRAMQVVDRLFTPAGPP
jgi:aryl-alcohol dehydrogenase-like predicted oxidoreductase